MNAHADRPGAIILAAGEGKRMKADLPKVVHEVGGRPMICAVVDACLAAGCEPIVLVVGFRQDLVRAALGGAVGADVRFAVQEEQLGTGHAAQSAREVLGGFDGDLFVLCGDGPLIRAQTLRRLLERHRATGAAATLATSVVDDPTGYGRIVRDAAGIFDRIVEHRDADHAQRAIREVNPSYYCFRSGALFGALADVPRGGAGGEHYLTDVLPLLMRRGERVEVVPAVPPEDVLSINTPEDLAMVDAIYRRRAALPAPVPGEVRP